jgi:hypothetical protein
MLVIDARALCVCLAMSSTHWWLALCGTASWIAGIDPQFGVSEDRCGVGRRRDAKWYYVCIVSAWSIRQVIVSDCLGGAQIPALFPVAAGLWEGQRRCEGVERTAASADCTFKRWHAETLS